MAVIAVFANPDSGEGKADEAMRLLCSERDDVVRYSLGEAERVVAARPQRIVVAGGDGSIGVAADVARRVSAPLGVVPVGTANDFARALGLPLEIEPACEIALRGTRIRRLELGSIEGRAFVNAASAGLSPLAANEAKGLKARLGSLAYAVGAVRAGVRARPIHCRVRCDSETIFQGEAWQVTVGVTGAFGAGSGIEADPEDGLLDVLVIEAGPRLRLVRHAYGIRFGRTRSQPGAHRARGAVLEVSIDSSDGFNVDGELVEGSRFRFECEPAAYEVVVG